MSEYEPLPQPQGSRGRRPPLPPTALGVMDGPDPEFRLPPLRRRFSLLGWLRRLFGGRDAPVHRAS